MLILLKINIKDIIINILYTLLNLNIFFFIGNIIKNGIMYCTKNREFILYKFIISLYSSRTAIILKDVIQIFNIVNLIISFFLLHLLAPIENSMDIEIISMNIYVLGINRIANIAEI